MEKNLARRCGCGCLIAGLLLAGLPTLASGGPDQVPTDRRVATIRSYEDRALVYFLPGFEDTQNCGTTGTTGAVIPFKSKEAAEMYALVLTAAATDKRVGFGINGCEGPYPSIYRVDVQF